MWGAPGHRLLGVPDAESSRRGHEVYALRLFGEIAARRDPSDMDEAAASYHGA